MKSDHAPPLRAKHLLEYVCIVVLLLIRLNHEAREFAALSEQQQLEKLFASWILAGASFFEH